MLIAAAITGTLAIGGLLSIFATGAFFSREVGAPAGTAVTVLAVTTIALTGWNPIAIGVFGVVATVAALLGVAAYGA